jgi:hypothetical protein
MPLPIATLDDRTYQDLVTEALARIPVHNPEWTNFNESDPGVTLLELFAFLTESLFYRANQIPDRNKLKFLSLLGVPLSPAASAKGLVAISNERGPLQTVTLNDGLEVRAGAVPFLTEHGLDVVPVEAQVYYKRKANAPTEQQATDYYNNLYASYLAVLPGTQLQFYETVPLSAVTGIDLTTDPVDGAVWIALLTRAGDKPVADTEQGWADLAEQARAQMAGRTLSVGIVPLLTADTREVGPGGATARGQSALLQFQLPSLPPGGLLPDNPALRVAQYRALPVTYLNPNPLDEPGVVEVTLPQQDGLRLWQNLEPNEPGVGSFPPTLVDTSFNQRLITWLRVSALDPVTGGPSAASVGLLWLGINAVMVTQRTSVANERLPDGTGEPDQTATLSQTPVVPDSVQLSVTTGDTIVRWEEVADLSAAGPEVPTPDPRLPPGSPPAPGANAQVFTVDPESGVITFGDGTRGARPAYGASLRASYGFGAGSAGNVGAGAINSGPSLPAGFSVTNAVRTWGGADAESVDEGVKQIPRYLQHRDRLVNATDFETIARRTPGVAVGRVDVIPASSPALATNEPGDVPGAVTLMVVPAYDPLHPDTPEPDSQFLSAVCDYLTPRRLVTTELYVCGPVYRDILVSVGLQVVGGLAAAPVYAAVKQALLAFLSPLPASPDDALDSQAALLTGLQGAALQNGWPRNKPVVALELLAVASRVKGVSLVNAVQIAEPGGASVAQIDMAGLNLPRVVGISVSGGDPVPVESLGGQAPPGGGAPNYLPVPVFPEEC